MTMDRKLPLIIGGLLLTAIVALSASAFVEMRRTSLTVTGERLASLSLQFRDLLQQSSVQLRTQAAAVAAKPAIVQLAQQIAPAGPDVGAAREALAYTGPNAEQVMATELRGPDGSLLASASPVERTDRLSIGTQPMAAGSDSVTVGEFRTLHDTVVYPVMARVRGGKGAYVVQWRRIAGSRRSREQLARLIGSEASLFVGNTGGDAWTDMERAVPTPDRVAQAPLKGELNVRTYTRGADKARYLSSAQLIPGTPWTVLVDIPRRAVMAPVTAFMRRMAVIGLIALLVGLFAAWTLSRKISLVELSRDVLEKEVALRTRDLEDAQESLVRRERLAMLGQLSSGVGHELRNPLGVMTNAVYVLNMVLKDQPPNVHEYLDILQQQIALSEKIVSDLLDFARQKPPLRKPTSVGDVTQAQLARIGTTSGVLVASEIPPEVPLVLVDQVQMGQIVFNLLTNAVQAMDGQEFDGSIGIRAFEYAGQVNYEVSDTGPGIAPEHQEKIFEPLFTTKARGIGLGLAVSRTLARANGGDLTVRSEPGEGATFRLTLPVATTDREAVAA